MKCKRLLLMLLMAVFAPWAAQAQEIVTIGNVESTSTSYHVPYNSLYNYSFVEQLYSAEEIADAGGAAGSISTIRFYHKPSSTPNIDLTNHIVVYMMNVDKTSFSAATDYVQVAASDIVFDGDWTIPTTTGWIDVELDTPFQYDGTSDLMVAVHETTSGYSSRYFQTTTTTGAVCTFYHDTHNPDPYNLGSYSGNKAVNAYRANIQLEMTFGGGPCCPKPKVTVDEVTSSSITFHWDGDGECQYTVYNATTNEQVFSESGIVNPKTISGLSPLTDYRLEVKAYCPDCEGYYSEVVTKTFTTTAVATEVGDGWADDFEATTCGWEFINGELLDQWCWGTATNNGGTHALYVSDDNGVTNNYSHNNVKVFAAKLLTFTDGKFEFAYDWKCKGESNYDFLRVALVPASQTLTAGSDISTISTTTLPTGWIALDGGGKLNLQETWQHMEIAVNVAAGNYYMVFAWRSDSSTQYNPPAAVDNVSITRVACAYDVTGLEVENITTNSATLVWADSEATQWQVAYADNASFENATEEIVDYNSLWKEYPYYSMTGLQPATKYYAKVRAYCGGNDFGAWSNVIDFYTDCVAIPALGYTENFDSYTAGVGVLPICWNKINTTSYSTYQGYPRIYNYSYQSSPNCLYFSSYYSSYSNYDPQNQYAILPEMENLAGKQITLSAKAGNATVTFKIGTMTDPADATTFTEMTTQALTTSYQEFEYVVPADATGHYLAIMMEAASSSSTSRSVYIDDIAISEAPSCFKPTGLVASNPTAHGATLNWALNDTTQTAWDVQVSDTVDFSRVVLFNENVNTHVNYLLTGLDPETHYYVRVRGNCGGGDVSEWGNTANFTTTIACPAPTGFAATEIYGYSAKLNWTGYSESYTVSYRTPAQTEGFFEQFNTNSIPTGWTRYGGLVDEVLAGTTELTSNTTWTTNSQGLGAYNAKLNIYGANCKHWLVTPEVAVSNNYSLDFDLALTDFGNSNPIENDTLQADDRFVVLVYADSTWTILREWNNTGSEYVYNTIAYTGEHVNINLSAYVGKAVKIAFYGESTAAGGDNDMHIDNVGIGIPVAASAWQTVTVDDAPVWLNDLTPNTPYEAKVQGDCGEDGLSLESNVLSFMTIDACPVPTGLAVVDSLLTATSAGLRWNGSIDVDSYTVQYRTVAHDEAPFMQDFESETALNGWTFIGDDVNGIDADGTYHAGLHTTAAHSGSYGFRFSSYSSSDDYNQYLISPELTVTGELKFYYKRYTSGNGEVFSVGYSTTTNDVEAFIWGDTINATTTWQAYTQELPADAKYFAIHYLSNYQYYLYVDDITIGAYTVPAGEWQTASSATTNVTLTSLTPETPYEAQVKSDCSDPEAWSDMVTFTTLEQTNVTQTIALASGANWVSFNVETSLDDLKAALEGTGNTSITIAYLNQNLRLVSGRWRGNLTFDLSRMYKISVDNACEITLEGMSVDPTMHPITIIPGANWIGFPLDATMAPADAFAGFAVNGDVISYSSNNARYTGGRWRGNCDLVGGHGYIYNSAATENRTLVFPSPSKAGKRN